MAAKGRPSAQGDHRGGDAPAKETRRGGQEAIAARERGGNDAQVTAAYQDGGRGATGGDRGPRAAGMGRHADNREGYTQAAAARQGGGGDEQARPAWQREEAAHRRPQEGGATVSQRHDLRRCR